MKIEIPTQLINLAHVLWDVGFAVYCVGGCVRDSLLKRPVSDIDICSALTPNEMIEQCNKIGVSCQLKCERTGTVLIELDGTEYEHTTFRTESYGKGGGHSPNEVKFTCELEKDAFRRDFSVNAIYYDIAQGRLIDPTGGINDIEKRVLRTTTKDPKEILDDDGLRLLRLVRFAHLLGFSVDTRTFECARENAALLEDVSFERKRDELIRILMLDDVYLALCCMDELGLWQYVVPELVECRGMAQRPDHHRYDVMHHIFHTVESMTVDVELRFAALLHDVGKPPCKKETGKQYLHDKYSERLAEVILKRLKMSSSSIERICFVVANHMFDLREQAKDETVRRRFCLWGVARVEDIIAIREADVRGSGIETDFVARHWRSVLHDMLEEGAPFSLGELDITGKDIMEATGLSPCKQVGDIQRQLLMHCAVHPKDNNKAILTKLLRDFV